MNIEKKVQINTAIFLQARIASKRLPAKIMEPILGKTMLEHIIDRLKLSMGYIDKIVILCSFESYATIANLLKKEKDITVFSGEQGEEDNVLKRFYDGNKKIRAKHIIRATADNPFISITHLKSSIEKHIVRSADLTIYKDLPLGSGVEVIKASAINEAYKNATEYYEKEHVTPYIYRNNNKFKILILETEEVYKRPDIRLTVDQIEDLKVTKSIFKELYKKRNIFSLNNIIELYDGKKLNKINGNVVQKKYYP